MNCRMGGLVIGLALVAIGCDQGVYDSKATVKVEAKMKTTDLVFNVEGLT